MKREIKFTPAFDRTDPDPSKNFGIHCMEMDFILTGSDGAIVFIVLTGWNLPHVREKTSLEIKPRGALISYHSRRPIYGESIASDVCSYLGDSPCYSDATYLVDDVFDLFVAEGEETVWKNLEQRYVDLFGKLD